MIYYLEVEADDVYQCILLRIGATTPIIIIIYILNNMFFKMDIAFQVLIFFQEFGLFTEIHLKVDVTSSLFTYARVPSSPKELAYIQPPEEVPAAVYDAHFHYFFSATTNEPTCIVLVIVKAPIFIKDDK